MLQLIRLLVGLAVLVELSAIRVDAAPNVRAAPKRAQTVSVDTLTCVVDYNIAAGMISKSDPSDLEYFEAASAAATSALSKERKVKPADPKLMKDIQDRTQRTTKMLEAKQISREDLESQINSCDARFNP